MKVTHAKNQKLIKQYPLTQKILKRSFQPTLTYREAVTFADLCRVDDLTIRVQKADGELLFREADNCGLGDNSCVFSLKGPHKDHIGRRGEYLLAYSASNKLLKLLEWPETRENAIGQRPVYGWHVLWQTQRGDSFSNPLYDQIEYLVWVSVRTWHKDTKADDFNARFGKLVERTMDITIYGKPDCGFEKLQRDANPYEHLRLTTRVMTRGAIDNDRMITEISGRLAELCPCKVPISLEAFSKRLSAV